MLWWGVNCCGALVILAPIQKKSTSSCAAVVKIVCRGTLAHLDNQSFIDCLLINYKMATSSPMKPEVLTLYRSLLRTTLKFCDYNIREYTKHCTINAFHKKQSLSDHCAISAAFSDDKAQLGISWRQAVVYQLYAPKVMSIMEFKPSY